MKSIILTCCIFILFAQQAIGQITIKGQVVGKDDGLPLPRVTVLIDSTSKGVATNMDGYFEISIPENSYLVFRYLGYITQKVTPKDNEFLFIKLKPDCTMDHFDSRLLYLGPGMDFINDQFGMNIQYTSRYDLPIDLRASASYYFNKDQNNFNSTLTILDIIHTCYFLLEGSIKYQSVEMVDYGFQNSMISIEPTFDGWTTRLGFGVNQFREEQTISKNLGLLIGVEKELYTGNTYIPVSISATFWNNKPEINISAQYQFLRNFRFKVAYQGYEDFNSIIGSLDILIRTWKKAF